MEFDGAHIMAALVAAVIVWWVVRAMLIAQMSNVATARQADEYLVRNSVTITERSDTYVSTKVDRRPLPKK